MSRVSTDLAAIPEGESAVSIGVFDGVHRGHQALLSRTRDLATTQGFRAVAVTFDRNPLAVVRPGHEPAALQVLEDKVAALVAAGMDHVHVMAFDTAASTEAPEDFITRVLAGPLRAREVVVGANFRFGHRAAGDVDLLRRMGEDLGYHAESVPLVDVEGEVVSSSAIRAAITDGDVPGAARLLGRPHRLSGTVVPGDGRGTTIGVPTANVDVVAGLAIPANGVYATRVARRGPGGTVHDKAWSAVTNIGTRPTFGGQDVTVEAHLLDVDVDLYGQDVVVDLVQRLRGEQKFDGADALVTQIRADIEHGRRVLV